jgi:WD40 repeat protein
MREGLIDKISLALLVLLVLTIGYTTVEWFRNAFQTHKHWVYSVDVSDDGTIASASENQILLWKNKYCLDSIVGHTDAIKSISFSHNNQFIVSGSIDKKVNIWSTADQKIVLELSEHTAGVNRVKFNQSDEYIISAGYDDKLFVWDWKNDNKIIGFDIKHTEFSINKSDILAFVDTSCNLNLFDLNSLSNFKTFNNYCGVPIFHPNGNILAIRTDGGILEFININSGEQLSLLDIKHGTHYGPVTFTPNGNNIVAGVWGGNIEIWDWKEKKLIQTLRATPLNSINDFSFNKENQLLSASGDQSVKTWDLQTGSLKLNIGDGLYKKQLLGVFSILCLMILVSGFLGVYQTNENKYSSWAVILMLSIWSLGILTLGLFIKKQLVRYSMTIIWILTVLSGLAVLSLYGSWLAVYIIPISLFLGYIKLKTDRENKRIVIPIVINLILCGVLTSFIVSAGLWR